MKRFLLTAFMFTTLWVSSTAQTDDPYHGGIADGHSMGLIVTSFSNPISFQPFNGGNGDGYDGDAALGNVYFNPPLSFMPYSGGNGDGYDGDDALGNVYFNNPPVAFAPFNGGDGDGYDGAELINIYFPNPTSFQPFNGGDGDGYDGSDGLNNQFLPNPTQFTAYFGGTGDGWNGYLVPNVAILPINLFSFEGKIINDQSLLSWNVAKENDIHLYNLQRSAEGRSYQSIYTHTVTNASSSEKKYDYTDAHPFEGANYYRLYITEHDGNSTYSQVVLLYFKHGEESVSIFPNPSSQTLNVQLVSFAKSKIRIVDMRGVVLLEKNMDAGSSGSSLSIGNFAAGAYMMQLIGENGFNKTIRFVKQ